MNTRSTIKLIGEINIKRKHILLFVLFFCITIVPLFSLCAPVSNGEHKIEFSIPKGVGASFVANKLKKEKLISNPIFFRFYLRLIARADRIQTGIYRLHDGLWMHEIAEKLVSGKVRLHPITIIEGWNNRQIGDYLTRKSLVTSREEFLRLSRDPIILKKYGIQTSSTEGYLYPDTYYIPDTYDFKQIHKIMLDKFFNVIKELGAEKFTPSDLSNRIILASIVEREARHPEERPIIARVFLNRLQKKMKLESCATVQYLFPKPRAKLYHRDLAIPSPYNTYIHYGMPPAPIANASQAALKAAFAPEKNEYLYFVVKPRGTHHFSRTYTEHIYAKKKYIDSDLVRN